MFLPVKFDSKPNALAVLRVLGAFMNMMEGIFAGKL
jgi:hypothetical protein